MQSQIGLSYNIPAFLIRGVKQPYKSWYCSELVWDAYNLQGHDIQNYDWMQNKPLKSEPGPTPSNLFHYSDVKIILDANKPL
jgi:uncharacterized protein YycO